MIRFNATTVVFVVCLVLGAVSSGCLATFGNISKGLGAYSEAPTALLSLQNYLTPDELESVSASVDDLTELYRSMNRAVDTGEFAPWVSDNWHEVVLVNLDWERIVGTVELHEKQTGEPIPEDLTRFQSDVETVYNQVKKHVDRNEKVKAAYKVIEMLARILAVKKAAGL